MVKKVSKARMQKIEKQIENGKKWVSIKGRNAKILLSTTILMSFLLGFFISGLQFSFAGMENLGYDLIWIAMLFTVISLSLFTSSAFSDYYETKHQLKELEEEYEEMET